MIDVNWLNSGGYMAADKGLRGYRVIGFLLTIRCARLVLFNLVSCVLLLDT